MPLRKLIHNMLTDFICSDRIYTFFPNDVSADGLAVLIVCNTVHIGVMNPRVRNKGIFNLDGEDLFGELGDDQIITTAEHVEHVAVGDVAPVVHADRTIDRGDVNVLVSVSGKKVVHGNPNDADFTLGDQVAVLITDVDDFTGVDAATERGICGEFFRPCDGYRAGF